MINLWNIIFFRKQDKPLQPGSSLDPSDPVGVAQNAANSIWRQYGGGEEGGPSQPRFDATKMKHAHEGYVGFNQVRYLSNDKLFMKL